MLKRFACRIGFLLFLAIASFRSAAGQEGDLVKASNLEAVNSKADETDPCLSADALTLYYASNASGTFDIMVSRRSSKLKPWLAGKPVPGLSSTEADERSPFLFPKKTSLFFATNAIPDEKLKNLQNFDIKEKVGERVALPVNGISEREDELHPCLTPSGKELYFSRKTAEGWVLYVANGPIPGPIGKAKPVGFSAGFHHASLAANGLLMVLQGPLDKGRWGLFTSRRTKIGGPWSQPEPITQLNHPEGEQGTVAPFLSTDGYRLFFASDRLGSKGGLDLWMVWMKEVKLQNK